MQLYEMENKFVNTREKYNEIANKIACKCINSNSFYRAMSAFRNYISFTNIAGASYFDTIPEDICAMTEHIEELAQKEE